MVAAFRDAARGDRAPTRPWGNRMVRRLSLALFALALSTSAASASPLVPAAAAAVSGVIQATSVPTFDLLHLFNRLTVQLGTVPVYD